MVMSFGYIQSLLTVYMTCQISVAINFKNQKKWIIDRELDPLEPKRQFAFFIFMP